MSMKTKHCSTIGEILERSRARYLRVLPTGLVFPDGRTLRTVNVLIRKHHPARTLYQHRKPLCRSLDGCQPLVNPERSCRTCVQRPTCTPQMLLTLLYELEPVHLLLAHTSLKNFVHFWQSNALSVFSAPLQISIINRGSWGEVTFMPVAREPTLFDGIE